MPVTKPQLDTSLADNYPSGVAGGITALKSRTHLALLNTAMGETITGLTDLANKVNDLKASVDGFEHLTQEQRDTIDAFIGENGGARGVITRIFANDAKHSFTMEDAAKLAEVAEYHNRSEEDILQIIATSPITPAESAKFLAVQTDIEAINTRLDELPTPEGIPQSLYDRIIALEAHLEFTPAERLQIVANMNQSADNAQSILTLIDNIAAANLRIDENAALRRITPQEIASIADIADLKARVNITPEQADKIAESDAIHADHEARLTKLETADGGNGLDQQAVDARVDLQLKPALITQEVVTHADITDIPVSVSPSAPAEVTTPITITDPAANPLKKDVITFTYSLEETANLGGFEPSMNFEVRQRDEVLATRTLGNPGDLTTTSFKGFLNEPFQVITRGTQNGDAGGRTWNLKFSNIAGARKGKLFDELILAIHNETDPDILFLRGELAKIKALTDGVGGSLATISEKVLGNADDINDVRDYAHATDAKIETPAMKALRRVILEQATTITTDATELNTNLGDGEPFAEQIKDGAIGAATQFITRFTDPTKALFHGSGQLARVINGQLIIYRLIPYQPPRVDTETRYITTEDGLGTLTDPAVLEFGVGDPRLAQDSEVFLTEGIPTLAPNQTMSNISFAASVRTNNNWQPIQNTIQLDLRSGESRSFAVPNVVGITFTATALANGQIRCRATHNNPDNAQQVTNGGAIRFDAGYTLTTNVAAVQRGQEAVNAGAFTGNNLLGFDLRQVGDSPTITIHIVTPTQTYDAGYYLNDAHRLAFATDNEDFSFLISGPETDLTPGVMSQLIGTDEYLGLFARTNHSADALDLGAVIIGRDSETGEKVTLSKADAGAGGGVTDVKPLVSAFTAIASATGQTPQSFTSWNAVALANPILNQNEDLSGNVYTAPVAGVYWFSCRISMTSAQNNRVTNVGLSINGADPINEHQVQGVHSSGTRAPAAELAIAVALEKDDLVTMEFSGTTGETIIPDGCRFSGYLIAATG